MRRLTSLLTYCCIAGSILVLAHVALADPIFTWRDAQGGLHYSNRNEAIPSGASEVELPPLPVRILSRKTGLPAAVVRAVSMPPPGARHPQLLASCDAPDPSGVAAAVAERLGQRELDGLTVIVAGVPIAYSDSANVQVKGPDREPSTAGPAEQAALAYPTGSGCPSGRPPLERYAVASAAHGRSRGLCEDYRRAFAEVGVAVSRDQGVARSFRAIAEHFVDVAGRDYTAGGRGVVMVPAVATEGRGAATLVAAEEERVPLPPWAVEAHVAQTAQLGEESGAFVDELAAALEEIDAAARSIGCW